MYGKCVSFTVQFKGVLTPDLNVGSHYRPYVCKVNARVLRRKIRRI